MWFHFTQDTMLIMEWLTSAPNILSLIVVLVSLHNSILTTHILNFKKYAVFIAGTAIYNITFHPLATFPDPKFRVALEIPSFWELCSGDSPANIEALHDEFGHIVRISPNVLSFGSSEAWRGMLLSIILLPTDDQ
jgi:hypothetical protein